MGARATGAAAHLSGDWTIAGVGQQVASLTAFRIDDAGPGATIAIDCSGIDGIDLSGFQLLFVWLHCIQLRGLRPELVNMPEWMSAAQERQGLATLFTCEPGGQGFV
jgi:ABC-type transporter Mla MlaB component